MRNFVRKTGAGEGIRTLDPNLGKSRSDVFSFKYSNLYCLLKSEHDPKMPNPNPFRARLDFLGDNPRASAG